MHDPSTESRQSSEDEQESAGTDRGIEVSNLRHGFDGDPVLEGVSASLKPGEAFAIIGPSGTGKTTLLRLLALFDRPDEGTVRLDGTDAWTLSERERLAARRRIGMVFQEPNLFDGSVRRNVEYGLQVRRDWGGRLSGLASRLLGSEPDSAVRENLETVGLGDAGGRDASSLSGGEAQRVAFARALAYDPEFLLLDEPTSDLDPRNTAVLEEAIEAARSRGLGVAIATHDMNQAERVADRVAVMLDGRLIEVGPAERVFTDPDDRRARKFIEGELVY